MMLYVGNREPLLEEVLNDPIVRLVMARDGLPLEEVRVHIEAARRRLPACAPSCSARSRRA
jgi:hypothetical protein